MGRRIGTFGLVNYKTHPVNKNYVVFNFNSRAEADLFEAELVRRKVSYEKDRDTGGGDPDTDEDGMYLFAVPESRMNEASEANFVVHSTFRQPVVKNKWLRYAFLLLFGLLIGFAIVGYLKNPQKPHPTNLQIQPDSL